jgi:hypothetical protein
MSGGLIRIERGGVSTEVTPTQYEQMYKSRGYTIVETTAKPKKAEAVAAVESEGGEDKISAMLANIKK